ncbi:alpha/beta hydrolase [Candidatus Bipolaricaulota bacterium]|jgi:acetyl esterase/lipase|nr:alpha/beta hydrolase [Candidatus Bipolaricaulota bacterium]
MKKFAVTVHPDRIYGERDGNRLTFDHYEPQQPNGAAILFVNSGGFESGKLIQYAKVSPTSCRFLESDELTVAGSDPIPMLAQFSFAGLLTAGFTVFDVRHSNTPYTVDDMLDDVCSAVVHIHELSDTYHLNPTRIGVFGASSGGHLALAAGLTAKQSGQRFITAIATYYPAGFDFPADIEVFPQLKDGLPALAVEDGILNAVSIKNLYAAGGPPTLVIYGDLDFPFIVNSCLSICSEFPKVGIETKCIIVEGAAHEFMREDGYHPEDGRRAQAELLQWFQQQLSS